MHDAVHGVLSGVRARIADTLVSLGRDTAALATITLANTLAEAVQAADPVIEAAPEKLP
jgi:hypothetical protein